MNINKKNLWCRNKYCEHINNIYGKNIFKEYNGCFLKKCYSTDDECRGAHNEQSIRILSNLYKYNNIKKNNINWVELYLNIIESIKHDKSKIINLTHKEKTLQIDKYNFIELIQFWKKLACYYRKIAKSLPSKFETTESQLIEGYKFKEDVPTFMLSDNLEDIAWGFVRLTMKCSIQQKFNESLKNKADITIWDVCLATGINCKEGVHKNNEMICNDDFLFGRCKCLSSDEIDKQILILKNELDNLNNIILDKTWTVKKNNKKSDNKNLILSIENKINELSNSRFIHYTEQSMVPFNEQYNNYLSAEKNKIIEIKLDEQKQVEEIEIKIKPVIKLNKYGKK